MKEAWKMECLGFKQVSTVKYQRNSLFFYFVSEPVRSWLSESPPQDVKYWIKSSAGPFQLAAAAIARQIQTCHCVPACPLESLAVEGERKSLDKLGPSPAGFRSKRWRGCLCISMAEIWPHQTPPTQTLSLKYAFIPVSFPRKRLIF